MAQHLELARCDILAFAVLTAREPGETQEVSTELIAGAINA